MQKKELERIEMGIKELTQNLSRLADEKSFETFIKIIHKPGWTTLAETAFVLGMVDSMLAQSKALIGLKQALLSGAESVELNPQPLPPRS
jgi:hypothetical protein